MSFKAFVGIFIVALALLVTPVAACSDGPYYTGFTILEQNSTVPHGWILPGVTSQLYKTVTNATIIATPTHTENTFWLLKMFGINQETPINVSDLPILSGVTDDRGFVIIPMYRAIKYNLTIMRENYTDKQFLIIPNDNNYVLYLGD